MENYNNVTVLSHPLITHKISRLRDKTTGTNEFRKLVGEIAMLEGFEALADLPLEDVANILLFLASDESRALTGQIIVSDFGATL